MPARWRRRTISHDAFCPEFADVTVRDDLDAFLARTRATHLFRAFPSHDPELPEALAPLGASRSRAVEIFSGLYEDLREPAQCHFDAVTRAAAVAA